MIAEEIVSGGKRYRLSGERAEDWRWIEDSLEESFLASIHPLYAQELDRRTLRGNALLQAAMARDNSELLQEIIIALDEKGERAGMIWVAIMDYQYTGERRGFVLQLYVSPAHRNRGLGRALMKVAERWTWEKGMRTIALHVAAGNTTALELYRSMDYEDESILMHKSLE